MLSPDHIPHSQIPLHSFPLQAAGVLAVLKIVLAATAAMMWLLLLQ